MYPGYVASATANAGVFVRFLARLTGLAPPSQLTDVPVAGGTDPEEAFALGQTVLARVISVDATVEPPRMSLSLAPRAARASKNDNTLNDAALVRAVFADVDDADALHDARDEGGDEDEEDEDSSAYLSAETAAKLAPGAKIAATVRASREYGVLVDMPDVDPDAVGLVAFHQLPGGAADGPGDAPEEGTVLRGVVLDVSRREGVVDVAARPGLNPAEPPRRTKSKKKSTTAAKSDASALAVGAEVEAIVELVKPEYAVVTLPEHGDAVGYAPTRSLNDRFADDDWSKNRLVVDGTTRVALVVAANAASGSPGGRLILARKDAGAEGGTGGSNGASSAASAGERMEGVIREAQVAQAIVDLPGGRRGRLHVTELPGDDGDFPARNVRAGDTVTVASMGPAGDRGTMLELTARKTPAEAKKAYSAATDAGAGDGGGAGVAGTAALASAKPGEAVAGVVSAVSADTPPSPSRPV